METLSSFSMLKIKQKEVEFYLGVIDGSRRIVRLAGAVATVTCAVEHYVVLFQRKSAWDDAGHKIAEAFFDVEKSFTMVAIEVMMVVFPG
jgi:hypothetical protein